MDALSMLFEEDIEMQDTIDDIQTYADDTEDMIIGAMEDRPDPEEEKPHLFTNFSDQVNDDGLTPDEENEINVALLNAEDKDLVDLDDDFIEED